MNLLCIEEWNDLWPMLSGLRFIFVLLRWWWLWCTVVGLLAYELKNPMHEKNPLVCLVLCMLLYRLPEKVTCTFTSFSFWGGIEAKQKMQCSAKKQEQKTCYFILVLNSISACLFVSFLFFGCCFCFVFSPFIKWDCHLHEKLISQK